MEEVSYIRFFLSFAFVIGLILLASYFVKRFKGGDIAFGNSKKGNLVIAESLYIDPRRKIIRVIDDGEEFLIMLGVNNELILSQKKESEARNQKAEC